MSDEPQPQVTTNVISTSYNTVVITVVTTDDPPVTVEMTIRSDTGWASIDAQLPDGTVMFGGFPMGRFEQVQTLFGVLEQAWDALQNPAPAPDDTDPSTDPTTT